ncbi:hypothetical protein PROFUN_13432 [Planoprotostelium fungivorum]|uniref:RNA methyltransferase n=1 Tax=Planoprotostelium fungivorum TaxID=1890364 RepID=A0A2P6N424_9EUKA|nr:hypothetical protein PROFUN_13432 [Planoprotostelium fungivorum]
MSGLAKHGNFHNYYKFNTPENRLRQLDQLSLFEGRGDNTQRVFNVLDVGCNENCCKEKSGYQYKINTLGVDLDSVLIDRAKEKSKDNPNVSFGRLDMLDEMTNVQQITQDFLSARGSTQFDLVVCFSITMWIHLNHGDQGLLQFLDRVSDLTLNFLIIEPQPWSCYKSAVKRHKKVGAEVHPLFSVINIRNDVEEKIKEHLSSNCGMAVKQELGVTDWGRGVSLYQRNNKL